MLAGLTWTDLGSLHDAAVAIASSGDPGLRAAGSARLLGLATEIASPSWPPRFRESAPPSEKSLAAVEGDREIVMTALLGAMDLVGGPDVVAYAFWLAEHDAAPPAVRRAALTLLAHHVSPTDAPARARAHAAWERVGASPTSIPGSDVLRAPAVVASMAPAFRRCYEAGLREDPDMSGSVRLTAKIDAQGAVTSVSPVGKGLSSRVVACCSAVVAASRFAAPDGGGATIVIPVTFVPRDTPLAPVVDSPRPAPTR